MLALVLWIGMAMVVASLLGVAWSGERKDDGRKRWLLATLWTVIIAAATMTITVLAWWAENMGIRPDWFQFAVSLFGTALGGMEARRRPLVFVDAPDSAFAPSLLGEEDDGPHDTVIDMLRISKLLGLELLLAAKQGNAEKVADRLEWMAGITDQLRDAPDYFTLVLRRAIAAHRAEHGEYPRRLKDLVPDRLPRIDCDARRGRPLGYERLEEGAVVFSRWDPSAHWRWGTPGGDDPGWLDMLEREKKPRLLPRAGPRRASL